MCVVTSECYLTTNPPFRTLTTAALLDNVSVESPTFRPPQMVAYENRIAGGLFSAQKWSRSFTTFQRLSAFGFYLCVLNRFKRSGRLRELVTCGGSTVLIIRLDR